MTCFRLGKRRRRRLRVVERALQDLPGLHLAEGQPAVSRHAAWAREDLPTAWRFFRKASPIRAAAPDRSRPGCADSSSPRAWRRVDRSHRERKHAGVARRRCPARASVPHRLRLRPRTRRRHRSDRRPHRPSESEPSYHLPLRAWMAGFCLTFWQAIYPGGAPPRRPHHPCRHCRILHHMSPIAASGIGCALRICAAARDRNRGPIQGSRKGGTQ